MKVVEDVHCSLLSYVASVLIGHRWMQCCCFFLLCKHCEDFWKWIAFSWLESSLVLIILNGFELGWFLWLGFAIEVPQKLMPVSTPIGVWTGKYKKPSLLFLQDLVPLTPKLLRHWWHARCSLSASMLWPDLPPLHLHHFNLCLTVSIAKHALFPWLSGVLVRRKCWIWLHI